MPVRLSHRRSLQLALAVATAGLAVSGCSSSSSSAPSTSTATVHVASTTCTPPANWQATKATAVAGTPSDYNLTSFDGTQIRIHWFPDPNAGGTTKPTVLMGPGWGQAGDTSVSGNSIQGVLSIAQLWQGGFNVLTWDPRGFGKSGGEVEVDSPNYEAKDVSAIINWVAQQHGVTLDRPGVPRIGMVGESYGGGIQFITAARDCRVDAIAPTIAWNSLVTSLYKNQVPKAGWSNILAQVGASARLNPLITASDTQMNSEGTIPASSVSFFASRGPNFLLSKVKVPTLILQGTVDNLFTLQEGVANYTALKRQGTTVSMAWFCGGHGVCLTNPSSLDIGQLSLAWMQHYVAKERSVSVLSGFTFVDQNGNLYQAPTFPLPAQGHIVTATTNPGVLPMQLAGGSGPPTVQPNAQAANPVDAVAYAVTPAPAANAVTMTIPLTRNALILGAPTLTVTYSGTTPAGTRPTHMFAQVVDPATGIVVGNQVTPIPLTLDGATHSVALPLESIVFAATPGHTLELQLVANTVAYAPPRTGGSVIIHHVILSLPTVVSPAPLYSTVAAGS